MEVLGGGKTLKLMEGAGEEGETAEAALLGDGGEGKMGVAQEVFGAVDFEASLILSGRKAGVLFKQPGEMNRVIAGEGFYALGAQGLMKFRLQERGEFLHGLRGGVGGSQAGLAFDEIGHQKQEQAGRFQMV